MQPPTPREEAVLALVTQEFQNVLSDGVQLATEKEACALIHNAIAGLEVARVGIPGQAIRDRKATVAREAIHLAALAVRFVLDLRLDRYLDLKPPVRPLLRDRLESREPLTGGKSHDDL